VNPTSEFDPCATAPDVHEPIEISDFAFRQSANIGRLFVDDLVVGTAFTDVVPNAVVIKPFRFTSVSRTEQDIRLQWETSCGWKYTLETSSDLTTWSVLPTNFIASGTNLTFTTSPQGIIQFFRAYRSLPTFD
jgi:hypothetical protein